MVGLPIGSESVIYQVIESSKPLLIDDFATQVGAPGVYGVSGSEVVLGSMVCAALLAGDRTIGVLSVGRVAGRQVFTETDKDQLTLFAGHAGLALELARAREAGDALARMEDRDQIAADLHHDVIQELFATGMGLEGLVSLMPNDTQRQRLIGYVDAIDRTIQRIRTTVFQLQDTRHPCPTPLLDVLQAVLQDHVAVLGFAPGLELIGEAETIPSDLADEVIVVVREALSNVARHARATLAVVRVTLLGDVLTVEVTDNGDGVGTTPASGGLSVLRRKAEAREGALDLSRHARGGTTLRWTARVSTATR
jgi:signal transduction histidine kinase